jgi:hypothetical protein
MKQSTKTPKGLYLLSQKNHQKQAEMLSTPGPTIRLLQRLMAPAPESFSMHSLFKDNQSK